MSISICLLTDSSIPNLDANDIQLSKCLQELGYETEVVRWDEGVIPTSSIVIVRSTWGYYKNIEQFIGYLSSLKNHGKTVHNSVDLIKWNSDKRYLKDLAVLRIPVIPTQFYANQELPESVESGSWVLKPTVSAGAWYTNKFNSEDWFTVRKEAHEQSKISQWMLQPYVEQIAAEGEWSVIFFNGKFSHGLNKRPKAGDFRVQKKHGGIYDFNEIESSLIDQASKVLGVLNEIPLYARVDGVVIDGEFTLMELELIEPELFTSKYSNAMRFAKAIAEKVS